MEEILEVEYEKEMKESFRDYAVSVIIGRAIPDVRDGFKPVHRRVMYAMKDLGILPNTPYKKSARIVGEVIGKYHPHGDTSAYDTMVKMAQDFSQTLIHVDGHGNFGSIDGDSPAAMRYTEARLSKGAMYLLQDLEKNVVDFRENYDGTEKEPTVLPAKYPNLLINGTFGIAVAMQSKIPTHNIGESIDAFLYYMKHPNATVDELLEYLPAPDFPTGGIIVNKEEFKEFYRTGQGKLLIRSKIEIEQAPYGKTNVVITEIPFTQSGNKSKLVNDLTMMVVDKKLNEITDVRDESSKDGIRIVLEVKKGVDIEKFLQKLYAKTKIQDSENYKFIALVNGEPKILPLNEYFQHYLTFQKEITTRKYQYLYDKGLIRKEILDGIIEAIDKIDTIVEAIRGSKTSAQMKNCLMYGKTKGISFKTKKTEKIAQNFHFTERQAKAILDMKLQRLSGLEVEELLKEHEHLLKELEEYRNILDNEKSMMKVIKKEHEEFKKLFTTPRKTEVTDIKQTKYVEEKKIENVIVLVDRFGYAKTMDSISSDIDELKKSYKYVIPTTSDDQLVAITNMGTQYKVKLKDIPKGKLKDKGTTIQALAGLDRNEYPIFVGTQKIIEEKIYLFVTKTGLTKQVNGKDFLSSRSKSVGTVLKENDQLVFVTEIEENKPYVLLQTKRGYVLKTSVDMFNVMNKTAKGVMSIQLKENDEVEYVYILSENETIKLSVNGKNVPSSEIPFSKRGNIGKLIN